jgi:hypothetical protein
VSGGDGVNVSERPGSQAMAGAGSSSSRRTRALAGIFFGLLVLVGLATFRDYGATWDEEFHESYAGQLAEWYRTDGRNDLAVTTPLVHDYGGLFEIITFHVGKRLPFGKYESRHVLNLAFGLLGIAFAYRLGRDLAGARAGLLAAAFLTLTPVYYGHMFANPKDIPFAALYLVAVDAIWRVQRSYPAVSWWRAAGVGGAIGLCMAVRVGGVVLVGLLALAVAIAEWSRRRAGLVNESRWRGVAWPIAGRLLVGAPLLAWAVMCAFWPYAWVSPLAHPLATLRAFSRYPWGGEVLFRGQLVSARDVPWDYIPTWLAVSLPDFLLVAAAIGCAALVLRGRLRARASASGSLAVVLVAGLAPLAAPVILRSTLYDGLRHVLFTLPPLITVIAVLYTKAFEGARRRLIAAALIVPVASGMVVTAIDMVELHPYQYVYFNRLVGGGLAGAYERFDTDYWCASIKEGIAWTVANVPADRARPVRIASGCPAFLTEYYLGRSRDAAGRFVSVPMEATHTGGADLYITVTRENKHEKVPGTVLHRVERQGAPLCYVIGVRPASGVAARGGAGERQ